MDEADSSNSWIPATQAGQGLPISRIKELLTRVAQTPGLTRRTAHTLTALPQLRRELERIREQGYALDQEEAVGGLRCVAGPVLNHAGQIVAAFSVAGPATRLTPARIPELAQMVRETSQQISFRWGYRRELALPAAPSASSR